MRRRAAWTGSRNEDEIHALEILEEESDALKLGLRLRGIALGVVDVGALRRVSANQLNRADAQRLRWSSRSSINREEACMNAALS